MGLQDEFKKVVDKVADAVDNVRDAASEAAHRAAAAAEQRKRDVAGDELTTGEKAKSVISQAKNTVQADIDATKQNLRNDG